MKWLGEDRDVAGREHHLLLAASGKVTMLAAVAHTWMKLADARLRRQRIISTTCTVSVTSM